ncbi:MAG: Uma2 family endonuclease [Gemmataceae bacterium]|nr:Uma2 family endonuclease [Gemmataceae bacterium]MCI0743205.1 Uma2 family endonuclease [Gemmataceae bacterium]
MATTKPRAIIAVTYEEAAQEYLRSLPLEHFMEATAQATQRKITLESLDLVAARRADVHVFNELLVLYPVTRQRKPVGVVPDNMVVISDKPLEADLSFNLPLEPVKPFWMLEYVSKGSKRKDYEDSFDKYERDLKTPYYLTFYPDDQELTLYHHTGKKYVSVKPNKHGRYAIPELNLEIGLLDGWVRYWYEGELLPLPAELQRDLVEATRRADEATRRAEDIERQLRAEQDARRAAEAELARLRAAQERPPARRNNGSKHDK